jgi:hypothetical protein
MLQIYEQLARDRQRELLASAASQRQALRAQALSRADRRAKRAERKLIRSLNEALRLSGELAAERGELDAERGEPVAEQDSLVRP